jgi:hypothetical protein
MAVNKRRQQDDKDPAPIEPSNNQLPVQVNAAQSQPAFAGHIAPEDVGAGLSTAADDNLVPMMRILQSLSPQVKNNRPEYIKGAKPGDIWLRNSDYPPISGTEGILFQPCYFSADFVEWIPRSAGGGLVTRHTKLPLDAVEVKDPKNTNRSNWFMPNGDELKYTRYHAGYVLMPDGSELPYVIPFTSTGHTVSRMWMTMMNNKQLNGARAPSWACLYRLRTRERINAEGEWFLFDISSAGWLPGGDNEQIYGFERGKALNKAMVAGSRTFDLDDSSELQTDPDQQEM